MEKNIVKTYISNFGNFRRRNFSSWQFFILVNVLKIFGSLQWSCNILERFLHYDTPNFVSFLCFEKQTQTFNEKCLFNMYEAEV